MEESSDNLMGIYFQKIQGVLLTFQFIEELIRMHISYCYQIIYLKVSRHIPFKYNYKDLQKDSLGTLISKFKKFNKDSSLITNIENIVKDRNYCAHQAYLLTYEQQRNPEHLIKEVKRIDEIIGKAENCLERLMAEGKQIEGIYNSIREMKS
ncbi:MAG: hypothetical protein ACLPSL_06300 [Smithella sp.]